MDIADRDVDRAESRAADLRQAGYATAARYDRRKARIVIELSTGIAIHVPTNIVQGLAGATPADLSDIEISPAGLGLHWPRLDADVYVPALLKGVFGSRNWMAQLLGKSGGAARTDKKSAASRANGKKGGRPRKVAA